jgi:hypothetical protein
MPRLDFNHGPFPLHHPDLHLANILFDDKFNITGIIDWSYTMSVPFEAFVNLQSDFGAEDCRSLVQHLHRHESEVDPITPISNYSIYKDRPKVLERSRFHQTPPTLQMLLPPPPT